MDQEMDIDHSGNDRQRKGRGFNSAKEGQKDAIQYETFNQSEQQSTGRVQKSVQGYVIVATNIHPEATEEDMLDLFSEYGPVSNLHLNLDRCSGFVKGYVLVEYAQYAQALAAVSSMHETLVFEQTVACDFAFSKLETTDFSRIVE